MNYPDTDSDIRNFNENHELYINIFIGSTEDTVSFLQFYFYVRFLYNISNFEKIKIIF
jgi:hypothetical protein